MAVFPDKRQTMKESTDNARSAADGRRATRRRMAEPGRETGRPLVLCDADEVLVEFARPLQGFLAERGLMLDFASFALTGNIRRESDGVPIEKGMVRQLISAYFESRVDEVMPVAGARDGIRQLSEWADILVLSNVPRHLRARREQALHGAGLPLKVVANSGPKGPAVARLVRKRQGPAVFIDDLPLQHASVAEHADHVHRVHFVANPRLARLVAPAEHCHRRIDRWNDCIAYLQDVLRGKAA